MTIHPKYIGCDVSKTHLDFFDPSTGQLRRIKNTPDSVATFLTAQDWDDAFVVLEATGSYDRALRFTLADQGIAFARMNPMHVRRFGEAQGRRAKTDRLDAHLLSDYGQRFTPKADSAPCLKREHLAALHKRRDQLVDACAREKTQRHEAFDDELRRSHDEMIFFLTTQIKEIERRISEAVTRDRRLAETDALLKTVPGVGPVTATTLLCQLPELGTLNAKSAAALAGLAPYNHDSGMMRGRRTIAGGRGRVRKALYIAALNAIRTKTKIRDFYNRLTKAGKPFKVAIIACARKLLTIINAMVRDNKKWAQ